MLLMLSSGKRGSGGRVGPSPLLCASGTTARQKQPVPDGVYGNSVLTGLLGQQTSGTKGHQG